MMSVHRANSINIGTEHTVITFDLGGESVEWEFKTSRIKTYQQEYARICSLDDRLHLSKVFTVEVPGILFDHQFNLYFDDIVSPTERELQEFIDRENTSIVL